VTSHSKDVSLGTSRPKRRLRVLCADDDQNVALILKYALENEGHHVECLDDGSAALRRVVEDLKFFDLIITDHHMPSLSGLEFVKKLRENKFPGRIIVHSSNLQESTTSAYQALEVDHILRKPVHLAELLQAVHGISRRLRHD
jgi:CheY-like chemotaxis protein